MLDAQEIGNALDGLQCMISSDDEVRAMLTKDGCMTLTLRRSIMVLIVPVPVGNNSMLTAMPFPCFVLE